MTKPVYLAHGDMRKIVSWMPCGSNDDLSFVSTMNCKESGKKNPSTLTDLGLMGGFAWGLRKPGAISTLLWGGRAWKDAIEMLLLWLACSQSIPCEIQMLEELLERLKSWSSSCVQQEPCLPIYFSHEWERKHGEGSTCTFIFSPWKCLHLPADNRWLWAILS